MKIPPIGTLLYYVDALDLYGDLLRCPFGVVTSSSRTTLAKGYVSVEVLGRRFDLDWPLEETTRAVPSFAGPVPVFDGFTLPLEREALFDALATSRRRR